jgi:hypothetical protein
MIINLKYYNIFINYYNNFQKSWINILIESWTNIFFKKTESHQPFFGEKVGSNIFKIVAQTIFHGNDDQYF